MSRCDPESIAADRDGATTGDRVRLAVIGMAMQTNGLVQGCGGAAFRA